MHHVESYIPELQYFQSKQQSGARLIHEDLAVLDATKDLRVLAGRGRLMHHGEPLASLCGLPREEITFLHRSLPSAFCTALLSACGVVLIFGDLLKESGTLLAVVPHAEAAEVIRALAYVDEPIVKSPALSAQAVSEIYTNEEVCEQIQEIFFYVSRILKKNANIGIWTRTLLLANLVGCRIDETTLPTQELPIANVDFAKLVAFVFCVFLVLRQKDGRVGAACESTSAASMPYSYQVSFEPIPDRKQQMPTPLSGQVDFPFLSHPAFRSFSMHSTADGVFLEAILPQAATAAVPMLRSAKESLFCLQIKLVG
ncbi:MAG: hypothetical protein IJF33_04935 [Clostridia bacterium]|nr:hypothetical protein [Clostridia bacterium]